MPRHCWARAGIRTLISTALVKPMAGGTGRTGRFGEIIWEYSQYSASAAEAWAARNQDTDPFAAHMLALLHGLGVVTVYRVLSDLYAGQADLQRDAVTIATALDTQRHDRGQRHRGKLGIVGAHALGARSTVGRHTRYLSLTAARALQFGLYTGALTPAVQAWPDDRSGRLGTARCRGIQGTRRRPRMGPAGARLRATLEAHAHESFGPVVPHVQVATVAAVRTLRLVARRAEAGTERQIAPAAVLQVGAPGKEITAELAVADGEVLPRGVQRELAGEAPGSIHHQ